MILNILCALYHVTFGWNVLSTLGSDKVHLKCTVIIQLIKYISSSPRSLLCLQYPLPPHSPSLLYSPSLSPCHSAAPAVEESTRVSGGQGIDYTKIGFSFILLEQSKLAKLQDALARCLVYTLEVHLPSTCLALA